MVVIGVNTDQDSNPDIHKVSLSDEARKQGTYIIGTNGTGKTTLLLNMIEQDMHSKGREGVCVLDPHGDFTYDILCRVPDHRLSDVLLLDPNDSEYPFGLNLLECNRDDPREKDRVVSTVLDTLHKLFEYSWGPRMEDLLRNSLLTLLYHSEATTLIDLMQLLVNYEQRQRLTRRAKDQDPVLRMFWEDEFPESTRTADGRLKRPREQVELISSSLNKIGRFITNPIIRHIIGQPKSTVNFRKAMDEGKIILVNLSKGDLGQDNSTLLGAVIVNQLLIAALSRRDVFEEKRKPFHLYVDEYQTFATRTFPELQSEARKYAIDTVVAHQYREQLDDLNKGSTLNVANMIVLRVSGRDAQELASQFNITPAPDIRYEKAMGVSEDGLAALPRRLPNGETLYIPTPQDRLYADAQMEMSNLLATIPNYQAICRILEPSRRPKRLEQFRIDLHAKSGVDAQTATHRYNHIRQQSRSAINTTREQVAQYIEQQTAPKAGGDDSSHIPAEEIAGDQDVVLRNDT